MPPLDPVGFAVLAGVTPRSVRRWIARGMPATREGRFWRIDPDAAKAWLEEHVAEPTSFIIPALEPPAAGVDVPAEDWAELDVAAVDRHVDRLSQMFNAFLDGATLDSSRTRSLSAVSTELRLWEAQRAAMRTRAESLIDREDHLRMLGAFAHLVIDELDAWSRSTPDAVIDALAELGVRVKAKRTARALDLLLAERADELRSRITHAVESAGDLVE